MRTAAFTPELLATSVIAVPPLARTSSRRICTEENTKLIRFLEAGGVSTLLYGGNAVFYHVRMSEYAEALQVLKQAAAPKTWVIPSVGPAYGMMMDQAEVLRDFDFPTVMVLPQRDIADEMGIARGIREFVARLEKPIVLYLKHDRWLSMDIVRSLYEDGLISWIKYAVVREEPREDEYLRELLGCVPANIVVSGIGEQPAIIHLRDFGIGGYTSGCVCIAPALSQSMLRAIQSKHYESAESIRETFKPLEDLRNSIQPIRVLHYAVEAAGIAMTGPMQPLLAELSDSQKSAIDTAAKQLFGHVAHDRS